MVSACWRSTGWPSFYNTSAVPERIDIIQFPSATNIDSAPPPLSHLQLPFSPTPFADSSTPDRNCCYDKTTSLDDATIVVPEFRHYHVLVTRELSSSPRFIHTQTTARGGRTHYHPNQLPWWPLIPMSPPLPATIRIDSSHSFPLLR